MKGSQQLVGLLGACSKDETITSYSDLNPATIPQALQIQIVPLLLWGEVILQLMLYLIRILI